MRSVLTPDPQLADIALRESAYDSREKGPDPGVAEKHRDRRPGANRLWITHNL